MDRKYLCQCTMGDVNSFFFLFFDNFSSLIGILGCAPRASLAPPRPSGPRRAPPK